MKIKTSIVAGLTIVIITVVSILLIPESEAQDRKKLVQTEIPVVIKPIIISGNVVPVHIQCQKVFITKPDTLDDSPCKLINGSGKSIRASGVKYSVVFDSNGKEIQIDRVTTQVNYIHPDLSEEKKSIEPGGSSFIGSIPISEPDSVVKRLELEPVYIEFDDGTTAGTGDESAKLIAGVREGAKKYKKSLRQKYLSKGKSAQEILPFLEDNAPLGSEIENFSQRTGAKAYRKYLREKYMKEGIQTINSIFDK